MWYRKNKKRVERIMKIICKARRGGKTTEIIKKVKEDPDSMLFVMNESEAQYISHTFDIPITRVCSWSNYKEKIIGLNRKIYIDDVDMFLQELFDYKIECASIDDESMWDEWEGENDDSNRKK
jgi:hypothetical protein